MMMTRTNMAVLRSYSFWNCEMKMCIPTNDDDDDDDDDDCNDEDDDNKHTYQRGGPQVILLLELRDEVTHIYR